MAPPMHREIWARESASQEAEAVAEAQARGRHPKSRDAVTLVPFPTFRTPFSVLSYGAHRVARGNRQKGAKRNTR